MGSIAAVWKIWLWLTVSLITLTQCHQYTLNDYLCSTIQELHNMFRAVGTKQLKALLLLLAQTVRVDRGFRLPLPPSSSPSSLFAPHHQPQWACVPENTPQESTRGLSKKQNFYRLYLAPESSRWVTPHCLDQKRAFRIGVSEVRRM